jgi:hypothetical protein
MSIDLEFKETASMSSLINKFKIICAVISSSFVIILHFGVDEIFDKYS